MQERCKQYLEVISFILQVWTSQILPVAARIPVTTRQQKSGPVMSLQGDLQDCHHHRTHLFNTRGVTVACYHHFCKLDSFWMGFDVGKRAHWRRDAGVNIIMMPGGTANDSRQVVSAGDGQLRQLRSGAFFWQCNLRAPGASWIILTGILLRRWQPVEDCQTHGWTKNVPHVVRSNGSLMF